MVRTSSGLLFVALATSIPFWLPPLFIGGFLQSEASAYLFFLGWMFVMSFIGGLIIGTPLAVAYIPITLASVLLVVPSLQTLLFERERAPYLGPWLYNIVASGLLLIVMPAGAGAAAGVALNRMSSRVRSPR